MDTKVISVAYAVAGMIVADDILTFNTILLIDNGSPLTDRVITRLKFYNIEEIKILYDETAHKIENEVSQPDPVAVPVIAQTKEFKEFNTAMNDFVNSFKTSLNDIFVKGDDVDPVHLLKQVNNVLSKSRNSFHLLNMLHTMRDTDDFTYVHCVNVSLIANVFAKWLHLSEEDASVVTLGGLLHDIGKLSIPKEILQNKSNLTNEEFNIMKTHPIKGYEALKDKSIDERIKNICLMHHERCDGSGYPLGLDSNKTEPFAKIIAICDCYDAMTSPRPYRDSLCPFEVIEFFEYDGLQKFDPQYLIPFLHGIVDNYINTKVLLSNGKEGNIIMINHSNLTKPVIQLQNNEFIDLGVCRELSIVKILDNQL